MEARIARLESDVGHLCSHVAGIKVDVRGLRDKVEDVDTRLSSKIDGTGTQLNARIDGVGAQLSFRIDGLAEQLSGVKDSIAGAKTWGIMLYIALAAGVFSTMAQGFGWL